MKTADVTKALMESTGERGADPYKPAPVMVSLADVQSKPVSWLWPGRIPLGKLTLIAGDPGLGKSFVTMDAAARVSSGTPWPDRREEENPAGGVVILSAEDDIGDTIKPRLWAAGADLRRIQALNGLEWSDAETGERCRKCFTLGDLPALERAIKSVPGCRLVIIDPVSAYMPSGVDSHRNTDIRGILAPLGGIAARFGVAIVCVSHLNKGAGAAAAYRVTGSLAFVAAVRAAWLVLKDADDPSRRLILPLKMNIAREPLGIAYRLIPSPDDPELAVVAWDDEPVTTDANDALAALMPKPKSAKKKAAPARDVAVEWLRELLTKGPLPAEQVKKEAKGAGIAGGTLRRAQNLLDVRPVKEGFEGGWVWRLPAQDAQMDTEDA